MSVDRRLKVLIALACIGAVQCIPPQRLRVPEQGSAVVADALPVIDSLRPDSVIVPRGAAVEVTVYGSGFSPGQPGANTVNFDRAVINGVQGSPDGSRIVFVVPDQIFGTGGAPPLSLGSGSYDVSVRTPRGESNHVSIRVYR
jgi:hypothetical protein